MKKTTLLIVFSFFIVTGFSQKDKNLILLAGPAYTSQSIDFNSTKSSHGFFLGDVQLIYKITNAFSLGVNSGYQIRSGMKGVPLGGTMNFYFPGVFNQRTPDDDLALYIGLNGGYVNILDDIKPKPKITYFGGQVGLRIWGTKFGGYLEAGYGKSIVSAGLCFKLL